MSLDPRKPALELRDLYRIYGRGDSEVRALDGINLQIESGEFVAIMGASGSGKSTCMNVLGCLDAPSQGEYRFFGVNVTGMDQDQRARLRRAYFGFVFQSFNLLPRTSARENVELPLVYRRVNAAERQRRALEALGLVGLADRAKHTPGELSGGQQQRVAIARALVSEPSLLLADEPTGNLDSSRSEEIMNLLVTLNRTRKLTTIMVTHDADIAAFVDRVIVFKDGRIVEDRRQKSVA